MNPPDRYRKLAAQLHAMAANAPTARQAAEFENLARCYIRLAEQADQNSSLDVVYYSGGKPSLEGDDA